MYNAPDACGYQPPPPQDNFRLHGRSAAGVDYFVHFDTVRLHVTRVALRCVSHNILIKTV